MLQDTILLGWVRKKEKTFQKLEKTKERNYLWSYSIKVKDVETAVCRQFLLSILQISEMRLRTVQNSLKTGTYIEYLYSVFYDNKYCKVRNLSTYNVTLFTGAILEDRRGKHNNRPTKITENVWTLVEEHWTQIPHKEAHYSRAKTNRKYFENPNLNVVKIYTAFKQYFYEKTGKPLKMGYNAYHKYFRVNSEYSFRQPRTDTCDYCAECEIKLKTNPDSASKLEYMYHKKRVEAYNGLKRGFLAKASNADSSLLLLEFDYAQNLPLPRLNITAQFYKRLLWLYTFNVHCHNDGSSSFFCFLESESKKDPNSVCSFLYHVIHQKLEKMPHIKKVVLLSDSCGGQNKNSTMVMFGGWLSRAFNVEVEHLFPVRGHSFSQCDRNFGKYGILLKQVESIETVDEYINIMRDSRKNPEPFHAAMSGDLIKDWATALQPMFLRSPVAKGYKFSIQKYVKLHYKNGNVSGSNTYTSSFQPFTFFNKKAKFLDYSHLNLNDVVRPGVKVQKRSDVLSLMKYLKPENIKWYEDILSPTQDLENSEIGSDVSSE